MYHVKGRCYYLSRTQETLALLFCPSTGLELSEASLLGGILSFSMSRSEMSKMIKLLV